MLERLGPEERAAFLLKEVFDYDYAQVADLIGHRKPTAGRWCIAPRSACRRSGRGSKSQPDRIGACSNASCTRSEARRPASIVALLDANARLVSDGGGKVNAVDPAAAGRRAHRAPVLARSRATRRRAWIAGLGHVNGEPALLRRHEGRLIHHHHHHRRRPHHPGLSVLNPDKLARPA